MSHNLRGVPCDPALLEEFTARLDAAFPTSGVPGIAVGFLLDGEEQYVVRGVTSVDNPLPVDGSTLFHTGSTGKTYTALALVRLMEQGAVDLDVPVRQYVPELRMADEDTAARLTLRHLLTHTGGHDGDLFDDFGGGSDCLSRFAAELTVLPQLAPLGTWTYSNAGFSIAGRAIETVTGLPYEQAITQLVLRPLGHQESVFGADAAITHRAAVGHRVVDGTPVVTRPWALPRTSWPAGGLASSVRDQIGYARFSLGNGEVDGVPLVSNASLRMMQSPLVAAGGGRAAAVGLSWLLQSTPGVIAHGGSANGQESAFVIVPDKGFAITVLTNSATGALLHGPLVKWALRNLAAVTPIKPATTDAAPADLPAHAGVFGCLLENLVVSSEAGRLQISLEPTAKALEVLPELQPTGPMPFTLYDDGRVLVSDGALRGARGEYLRDDAGDVRWLRMLGRIHVRR